MGRRPGFSLSFSLQHHLQPGWPYKMPAPGCGPAHHPDGCSLFNTLTNSLRQGFCFQSYTCCAISDPRARARENTVEAKSTGMLEQLPGFIPTLPRSGWAAWRRFLYHSASVASVSTAVIMVSSLSGAESTKRDNVWVRYGEQLPTANTGVLLFSLHAYVTVHVSSTHQLCLVVLERPGGGRGFVPRWLRTVKS